MCFSSPQGGAVEQGSQARDQHFIITSVKEVMFSPWFVYLFVNCCVSKSPSQCIILQFGQYVGLPNGSGWLHILCWSDLSWVEGAQCSTRALTVCANMIIAEHGGWNWMNSNIFKDCLQNVWALWQNRTLGKGHWYILYPIIRIRKASHWFSGLARAFFCWRMIWQTPSFSC